MNRSDCGLSPISRDSRRCASAPSSTPRRQDERDPPPVRPLHPANVNDSSISVCQPANPFQPPIFLDPYLSVSFSTTLRFSALIYFFSIAGEVRPVNQYSCMVYSPLVRNSLKEICFMPFSSLAVRSGVALITYFG